MEQADWLILVEGVGLYGAILAFAIWEVVKMRRHARKRAAEKAAEADQAAQQSAGSDRDSASGSSAS